MYAIVVLFLQFLMIYMATSSQIIDLNNGINMTWSLNVPDISNMPHNNHYKLFHDVFVDESVHILALLRWNSFMEDHPTKCNLTLRTHTFDGQVHEKICVVKPTTHLDNDWMFAESVIFLKSNRVLISWREKHKTEGLYVEFENVLTRRTFLIFILCRFTHNIPNYFHRHL